MRKKYAVTLAVVAATTVLADGKELSDSVLAHGRELCSRYAQIMYEAETAGREAYLAWALGYLSALGSDGETNYGSYWMEAHMRQFCENNPDAYYVDAVVSLSSALSRPFQQ